MNLNMFKFFKRVCHTNLSYTYDSVYFRLKKFVKIVKIFHSRYKIFNDMFKTTVNPKIFFSSDIVQIFNFSYSFFYRQ